MLFVTVIFGRGLITSVSRFENSIAYEIEFSDTEAFQNILAELGICE